MSKKKRTFPLHRLRENYTYSIEQITDLSGRDIATIRRWIKDEGLEKIPGTRPALIHSSVLKAFWSKKKKARKQQCKTDEAYCLKCRHPRRPETDTGKVLELPNGSVRFQGKCSVCKGKINKAIKGAEWPEKHPLGTYLHDATKQHNGAQSSPRECQFQKGEQLCLNITLKTNA